MAVINFAGIASGIDSTALIEAVSEAARSQRVKPHEKKITELEDTNDALTQLKTKLTTLQGQLRDFASINGGALLKQGASSDETVITASAGKAASNGTYSINVAARAKNATFSFNDRFASTSTVIDATINDGAAEANRTVSFSVGTSSPQSINVVLTSTTTASQFVDSFNQAATTAGGRATASLVNVGTSASPSYAILINSTSEGLAAGQITLNSVGSEIAPAFAANTLSQATDASFTVSGITGSITRSSNSVSDVISGVTLSLNDTGTSTISITDDSQATAGKVQDFIDTWNEMVTFIAENNRITREEDGDNVENVFSPLASERTDDNILSTLRTNLSESGYDSGLTIRIFADLGITTQRDGTLKFDADVFEEALASEPNSANEILMAFADETALTGGSIDLFIRFNGVIDSVTNNNSELVTSLNDRIAEAEKSILRNEESMRLRFARLEGVIGQMQNQQSALTSALAGLG